MAQNLPSLRLVDQGEADDDMLQDTSLAPEVMDAKPDEAPAPSVEPEHVVDERWLAGRKLTAARLARGLSLDQVAERIRVRREYLEALEDMNLKLLPGKAYALAFLRSYARELGLDDAEIVDQFQRESALSRQDAQKQIRNPASRPHRERPWLAAAALAVVAAGFVGWRAMDRESAPVVTADPATPGAGPAMQAEGPVAAAVEARRVVEIKALADAWLEARGPDGTVFLSRTLRAGDVYRPDPSPGWTLHARDGAAFEVYIDGQSAGLLGNAGMPVLGRAIDGIELPAGPLDAPPRS